MTFEQKLCCAMAAMAVVEEAGPGLTLRAQVFKENWLQAYRHATGAYCDGNKRETRKGFGYLKSQSHTETQSLAYKVVSRSCPSAAIENLRKTTRELNAVLRKYAESELKQ